MSRIDITSSAAPLSDGILQTANPLDATLQVVTDNVGTNSTLLLSTDTAQFNSTLHIHTNNAELLDIEDSGSNNRFNINRDVQKINLDFASKPTDITTVVGGIRTYTDGINLSDAMTFRENGNISITKNLGIGVTTPTQVLDVNGNVKATSFIVTGGTSSQFLKGNGSLDSTTYIPTSTTGILQTANPISSTLQTVKDYAGNNTALQVNNGRIGVLTDTSVTTQTSSVIQSTTTNANLVLSPNGTGAIVANIPDGTTTGGNSRGTNAVDLQMGRGFISNVASGASSVIVGGYGNTAGGATSVTGGQNNSSGGQFSVSFGFTNSAGGQSSVALGQSNSASSNFSTVSGGQSNTASTNTHATVVGGLSNTASGIYSIVGVSNSVASGSRSIALGESAQATGQNSVAIGGTSIQATGVYSTALSGTGTQAIGGYSLAQGYFTQSYLYGQVAFSGTAFNFGEYGYCQQSTLVANRSASLTTGGTTVLSLDGTGVTRLIIPSGNNRAWNVQVNWVAVVTAITGTATGISVGDVVTSVDLLGFKRVGGTSSASAHTSAATKTMVTTPAQYAACAIAYSAGASQEMAMTFTGPTFIGGGSVTMRVVARIELSEVAW